MKKLLNEWKKYLAESLNEQDEEVLDSEATYPPPETAKQKCDEKSKLYAKRGFDINPTKFLGDLGPALVRALELKTYTGEYPKDGVQELNNWSLYTYIPALLLGSHCFSPQPTKTQMDQKLGDLETMLSEAQQMMVQKVRERKTSLQSDKILTRMYLNMGHLINAIGTARYGNPDPEIKEKHLKHTLSKLKPIQMTNN